MHRGVVFVHVASAFLFMLSHGAAAAVMFRLRGESQPERLQLLLARSNQGLTYGAFALNLFSGIALGFLGRWWSHGWIWAALGSLVVNLPGDGLFRPGLFRAAGQSSDSV